MELIPEEVLSSMRESLIGSKVKCVTESGSKHQGICTFFGYNKFFPSWGIQLTLDNFPVTNVKLNTIEII